MSSFDAAWDRCAPWIEAALHHGQDAFDLADIKEMVLSGDAQFWEGRGAAMVTRIDEYPKATWLLLWLAGGDMDEIVYDLVPMAEAYGKQHGCGKSVIIGRTGWSRVLAADGYKMIASVIGKGL